MRDTTDRWRSPPAAPCRYRLPRPAALPHARGAAQPRKTLRPAAARSTMICETAVDENALSDSGPYEDPPFKEEVPACDVRVSILSGVVGCSKSIPACWPGTEARRLNRGRSRLNFDDTYFLTAALLAFFAARLACAFS